MNYPSCVILFNFLGDDVMGYISHPYAWIEVCFEIKCTVNARLIKYQSTKNIKVGGGANVLGSNQFIKDDLNEWINIFVYPIETNEEGYWNC